MNKIFITPMILALLVSLGFEQDTNPWVQVESQGCEDAKLSEISSVKLDF